MMSELSPNSACGLSSACVCTSAPTSSPVSDARKPRMMVIRPTPPLSTTPAFLSTGRSSGVLARALSPSAMTSAKKSSKFFFLEAIFTALSLIMRTTVRMVPSLGTDTAP